MKILDEFTHLPVSRQRKQQLRLRRDDPERYKQMVSKAWARYRKQPLFAEYRSEREKQRRIKHLLGET